LLADHFLAKYAKAAEKPVRGISREAHELLSAYEWPGNVRELENVIERAVALEQTPIVLPESLPAHVRAGSGLPLRGTGAPGSSLGPSALPDIGEGFDLEAQGEELYRHYITLALERTGGVQTKAAEMLGMSFRSFRYYAKKFHLR
jgi:two-component system response regulator PilR (NtrC family)